MPQEPPSSIDKLPSIIARPFSLASSPGPQRKDHQRFCLENTISFLALLAASDLLQYFRVVRDSEESSSQSDAESLQNSERLTGIDLDQMSLGKWVGLLRETTREVKESYSGKTELGGLVDFYHGKNASKTVKVIDELVAKRNNDAHGNPIPEDKLQAELEDRQAKLSEVVSACGFLEDYRLVVFDRFDLINGKTVYGGRAFVGTGSESYSLECDGTIPQNQPILIHEESGRYVGLAPLLVHAPIDGQENKHLAVFSKNLDRDGKRVRYIGLDGHSDIEPEEIDREFDTDMVRARSLLLEIYSDPEVYTPTPAAELKLKQTALDVGDSGEIEILIQNPKKSVDLAGVDLLIEWPAQIHDFVPSEVGSANFEAVDGSNMGKLRLDQLKAGGAEKAAFEFKVQQQGSLDIGPSMLSYNFFRTEVDREADRPSAGEIELERVTLEARDPKSHDVMTPVINLSRRYFKKSDEGSGEIKIGDPFVFEIELTNIGFAAARDLSLEIIFPPGLELVDGIEVLSTFLNPGESRVFRYTIKTRKPGIYQTKVRNLTYKDGLGIRYATRCDDDHRVIVRSDINREFDYAIESCMDDLYLSAREQVSIENLLEDLVKTGKTEGEAQEQRKLAEFNASLRIIREIVKEVAERRGYRLKEEIYEETARQAKKLDRENGVPRRSIVFSAEGFPFFAVDVTDPSDLRLHALSQVKLKDDSAVQAPLFVTPYVDDQVLDGCIPFSAITSSEKLGRNFIKAWVNQCIGFLDRHLVVWKTLAEEIGTSLSCEFVQRKGFFQPRTLSDAARSELGQDKAAAPQGYLGLIRDPRAHKKPTFIFFANLGSDSKKRREELVAAGPEIPGLLFLTYRPAGDGKEELRLTDTWYESERSSTRTPAVRIEVSSDADRAEAIEKVAALVRLVRETAATQYFSEDEDFNSQNSTEVLEGRMSDLRKNGIGVRRGEWQDTGGKKASLEFYSMDDHNLGAADTFDCFGFMNTNGKNWDLWLNYYSNDCDDDGYSNQISIHPRWPNQLTKANRWLYVSKVGVEPDGLDSFVGALCSVVKGYDPDALSVWPEDRREEMLIAMGKESSVLFDVLRLVASEPQPLDGVRNALDEQGKKKELEKFLRQMATYRKKYRRVVPVEVSGESGAEVVSLTEDFVDLVQEMLRLNPELDFGEAGDTGRINGYLADLKKSISLLANKTVSNKRVQHKGKDLRVARRDVVLALLVNQTSLVGSVSIEETGTQTDVCEKRLDELRSSLVPLVGELAGVGDVVPSGRSDQSRKLEVSVDHENFKSFDSEDKVQRMKEFLEAFGSRVEEWSKS